MDAKLRWPLTFEEVTKHSTRYRRLNGTCPTITNCNKLWLFKNSFFPICLILYFCLLVRTTILNVKNKAYSDAINIGALSTMALTIVIKHLLLLRYRKSIKEIIDIIDKDYETAKDFNDEEKCIIVKHAQMGMIICKSWLIAVSTTLLIFPLRSFTLMGYYFYKGEFQVVHLFDINYPFIEEYKDYAFVFCFLFIVSISMGMYATSCYIGFDPLVPNIVVHLCGQLELITNRLSKIFSTTESIDKLNENLKQINLKLIEIYRIVDMVQNNFVTLYEYVMKTTTLLIAFGVFQIVQILKHGDASLEFIGVVLSSVIHIFNPCYFCDLLTEKGEQFREAIYFCGWESQPHIAVRKTILIMLTRTTKPVGIKTLFKPLSLDTFAEIIRQSYAIYNIMNATWG